MLDLTILVPTYNRPAELEVCLRSILSAFGEGQKVIIGDNGDPVETANVLARIEGLAVNHLANPKGTTYVDNVQNLLRSCTTEWLSILHDDDFFTGKIDKLVAPFLQDPATDFVFSDHWVCDHDGTLNEAKTEEYSSLYGRSSLAEGLQQELGVLAASHCIPLDGFFIKTALALSSEWDRSFLVASDFRWLIEICDRSQKAIYLKHRLFTYRLSASSLTNSGSPLKGAFDFSRAMFRTKVTHSKTKKALTRLQQRAVLTVMRVTLASLKPRKYRKFYRDRHQA